MKLIYIAGPIKKDNQWVNGKQADDAMYELMAYGFAVINPMLTMWAGACNTALETSHTAKANLPADGLQPLASAHGKFAEFGHADWLKMDFTIIKRCDAVIRLPGASSGADAEVAFAEAVGVPVFHNVGEVIAWANK